MAGETDLVKERLDLADVIGEYVPLKRTGAHFKGLCPFHQEKTPSFIVSPEKGIWHCFGCGKGGDVFVFIQEIEGVAFPEALKQLAERAGVPIRRTSFAQGKESQSKKQRLFEVLGLAAKFYHAVLMQHEAGRRAQAYLAERGVREETMREFELGYAPMRWDTVQKFLQKKGFSVEEMIQAGLVGAGQGGKFYDRFRGRIMFPVTDVQGRIVAFGGRIVPWHATGEEGKYINSPETALYEKRKTVYNLSRAKAVLRGGGAGIVVEGYMDVVMLAQGGVKNVVATSGTAFTTEHIQQLGRYTKTLHFAFDADAAGSAATVGATESALDAGMRVATLVLPAGEDPADIAAKRPQQVQEIFSKPRSLISVLLERMDSEEDGRLAEEHVETLLPLLTRVHNVVLKGEMVREIAERLTIPESDVVRRLSQPSRRIQPIHTVGQEVQYQGDPLSNAERVLLGIMVISPSAREMLWGNLRGELFVDGRLRELYNTMHNLAQKDMNWARAGEEELVAALTSQQQPLVQAVSVLAHEALDRSGAGAAAEAQVLTRALQRRYLSGHLKEIQTSSVN
ncbi:MAG: DNA primase, partial [Patescibacteria group bacterium]